MSHYLLIRGWRGERAQRRGQKDTRAERRNRHTSQTACSRPSAAKLSAAARQQTPYGQGHCCRAPQPAYSRKRRGMRAVLPTGLYRRYRRWSLAIAPHLHMLWCFNMSLSRPPCGSSLTLGGTRICIEGNLKTNPEIMHIASGRSEVVGTPEHPIG